jgi:hypothetical protein
MIRPSTTIACSWESSDTSHNPRALLLPGAPVMIHQKDRCDGSEFATWIDVFWREDKPWVVLQLPSGRRTAVPASWTDLDGQFSRREDRPQILPAGLLELARYCHGQRKDRGSHRPSKGRSRDKT